MKIINKTKKDLRIDLYSMNAGQEEPDHLVERINGYSEVGKYNQNVDTEFPADVIEITELKET